MFCSNELRLVLFKVVSYAYILVLRLIQGDVSSLVVNVESKHRVVSYPSSKRHSILSVIVFSLQMIFKKISDGMIFKTCSSCSFQDSSLPDSDLYDSLSNY